ncbi:hypothetical protein [Enterococcus sp. AZ126]|uniref:hypothetical protein n=1 Tax=Enterococcus sp. AZ126 TaxID=2774635 RepID=UPI003F1E540D
MFEKKSVLTSLVVVAVLGSLLPTVAQATEVSSKSDATLTVTRAAESGSLRFDTPEKLNITFADMEISEKTLKEIETMGIGEKEGTKAQLKVVDERMDIKGDPAFYVTAKMAEGNYGDKNFLQNGMYVSLKTDTSEGAYPIDLDGAKEKIIATGDKKTPIEKDLNARLHVTGNALDLTAGNYGTSITWTAVPTVKE